VGEPGVATCCLPSRDPEERLAATSVDIRAAAAMPTMVYARGTMTGTLGEPLSKHETNAEILSGL